MLKSDVSKLLTFIAVVDKRTVGPADVEVWAGILPPTIALADATEAVREHFRESRAYLTPFDVIDRSKKYAKARVTAAGVPDVPSGLSWSAERRWSRRWAELVRSGADPAEARARTDQDLGVRRPQLVGRPAGVPAMLGIGSGT